jgi:hypothetical protein
MTHRNPWYREPWPWILMSGPAIVVVASFATLALAVSSNDGLVADDYYKQGLGINREIGRDEAAREMGLTAAVQFNDAHDRVRVLLRDSETAPAALKLALLHPTRDGEDQRVTLARESDGVYSGRIARPHDGRWRISLQDADGSWRLVGDWRTDRAAVTLGATVR